MVTVQAIPVESNNNLPIQISVIVPSTRFDKKISKANFQNRIKSTYRWFNSRFGGSTSAQIVGSFLDENGRVIEEQAIAVISSTTISKYKRNRKDFADFLRERKKNWEQDSIYYQVEGRAYIYPKRDFIDDDKTLSRHIIDVN